MMQPASITVAIALTLAGCTQFGNDGGCSGDIYFGGESADGTFRPQGANVTKLSFTAHGDCDFAWDLLEWGQPARQVSTDDEYAFTAPGVGTWKIILKDEQTGDRKRGILVEYGYRVDDLVYDASTEDIVLSFPVKCCPRVLGIGAVPWGGGPPIPSELSNDASVRAFDASGKEIASGKTQFTVETGENVGPGWFEQYTMGTWTFVVDRSSLQSIYYGQSVEVVAYAYADSEYAAPWPEFP
ncbi:MAG: hypothetical protein AABY18_03080 [Candidatus Thermoplasmatota archaeon]